MILVLLYSAGTTILSIPGGLAAGAKQDAWIVPILAAIIALPVIWVYVSIGNLVKDSSWSAYLEKNFGRWTAKFMYLIFAFYCFIGATSVLYYMGNFVTLHIMPETPVKAIHGFFMIIVVMAARAGASSIARTAEILLPWAAFVFVSLVVFLVPQFETKQALPMLENGVTPIIRLVSYVLGTAVFPLIVMFSFYPGELTDVRKANKGFFGGTMMASGVMTMITLLSILVLGGEISGRQMFPGYVMARKIDIGNFFQRIEILIAAMWFITVFFKTALYFYGIVKGMTRFFGLKDRKPLTYPLAIIVYVYSGIVYPNVAFMQEWDTSAYIPYVITFAFVAPLIVLIVGKFRNRSSLEP